MISPEIYKGRSCIQIGDNVPDFDAVAYHEEKDIHIKLSSYRGKWVVLLFYPADFTFVCPTELAEAAHLYHEFQKNDAEIMSISTDSVYVHKAWHDHSELVKTVQYPMISDPTAGICKAFGTYLPEEGVSLRATAIIDPDSVLKAFEIHDNSIGRSIKEILRKLQAAKFVREHPNLVCPASWEPGKDIIEPGLELAGNM